MRNKLLILGILAPLFFIAQPAPAGAANLFSGACPKGSSAANSPTCQQASNEGGSNNRVTGTKSVINTAVSILALITGIAAVVMILISGFQFVTAGGATPGQRSGDPNKIKSARATLTASIVGLVVVALAWTITRFIVDRVVQ